MLECAAVRMSESLKNGRQQYEAWNENSVELVRASKVSLLLIQGVVIDSLLIGVSGQLHRCEFHEEGVNP